MKPEDSKPLTCACGAPVALYCVTCGAPLCWAHIVTKLLVARCSACVERERTGKAGE